MLYSATVNKTAQELAQEVNGKVIGDASITIKGITNMESPQKGFLTFVQDAKALRRLEASEIACLLVPPSLSQSTKTLIQVANPKLAWAQLLRHFFPAPSYSGKISDLAAIATSANIGRQVTIEPFASIGEEAEIGDGAVIQSHVRVGSKARIGANSVLYPGVTVYDHCIIGKNVIIHAGSVIGADGFGYVATPQGHQKVPQVGNVIIEDDVEIGACVTVDRATVGATRIGTGCKIDNLVQIGHNVTIGPHTVISAQTGISGSCKIGAFVTMGGKVGIGDHAEIGDQAMIGAGAGFPSGKKVPGEQIYFGQPARPYHEARKQIAAQLRSAEMLEAIRELKQRVSQLEEQLRQFSPQDRL